MPGRLVVTGQTADGKSVFVSDTQVEPIALSLLPGAEFHRLWGSDDPPGLPTDGTRPEHPAYFPPSRWLPLRVLHSRSRVAHAA